MKKELTPAETLREYMKRRNFMLSAVKNRKRSMTHVFFLFESYEAKKCLEKVAECERWIHFLLEHQELAQLTEEDLACLQKDAAYLAGVRAKAESILND